MSVRIKNPIGSRVFRRMQVGSHAKDTLCLREVFRHRLNVSTVIKFHKTKFNAIAICPLSSSHFSYLHMKYIVMCKNCWLNKFFILYFESDILKNFNSYLI